MNTEGRVGDSGDDGSIEEGIPGRVDRVIPIRAMTPAPTIYVRIPPDGDDELLPSFLFDNCETLWSF